MTHDEITDKIARCAAGLDAIAAAREAQAEVATVFPGVFVHAAQFAEVAAALAADKAAAEAELTSQGD